MEIRDLGPDGQNALEKILGYLNFSSGSRDPQFLKNLNLIFSKFESKKKYRNQDRAIWRFVFDLIDKQLEKLRGTNPAFMDCQQVDACLSVVKDSVIPGYFAFHNHLLFHQTESALIGSLFLGRIFEVVLSNGVVDTDDVPAFVDRVLRQLNDFVGYRPLPVLQNQRFELYPHEKVATIPVYFAGVGVSAGPYQTVIELTLDLLRKTDPDILRAAYFDPEQMQELAIDPRSYDFEHPVNKRPNYHFGQWDPHAIDNKGHYYRYVIQQVTLNALMQRVAETNRISRAERAIEAAAVLAGTMLMA